MNNEIVEEDYFPYINLSKEERNFYINLILNGRELTDSARKYNRDLISSSELMFLSLIKEGEIVRFEGAVSNNTENKIINGIIIKKNDKRYIVDMNVYRFFELVKEDDRDYKVVDDFNFNKDLIVRRSLYSSGEYSTSRVTLKNDDEINIIVEKKKEKTLEL